MHAAHFWTRSARTFRHASLGVPVTLVVAVLALGATGCQPGTIRVVGPGHPFAKPCQAIAASAAGDTVQIDAAGNGTYDGDVCQWSTDNLTIVGINGRAHIDAAGRSSGGKAIWVISGANTTVRDIELSGTTVGDHNGAGIRQEGAGLTVTGSYFHHNENGILAGANPASDIVIDSTEFANNGYGDGYTHNMYIGAVRTFTLRHSYSRDSIAGQLVKSRAAMNVITYNRLTGNAGTSNYEIDLPNGGLSYVVGNVIQQGPLTSNSALVAYGAEGVTHPSDHLYVINNTIVNDKGVGTAIAVGNTVTTPAVVKNNISVGSTTFVNQATATLTSNCLTANPLFVNRTGFDYHLLTGSPCLDAGTPPGSGDGFPLTPTQQYVYNLGHTTRPVNGTIDAGAFER